MRIRLPRPSLRAGVLGGAATAALAAVLGGGCTNEPFDPGSVPNQPPVVKIFARSVTGDTLNATSYNHRTFRWSGSDADGRVVAYYVTVHIGRNASAAWDTTTRTDTTMTFTTDETGHAEAVLRVACRDDRGALSDTVTQFFPLKNFPPAVNFQADFDTLRWSYGAAGFRFFALDIDGNETMPDSIAYRLDTADTTVVRREGEPGADPAACWVWKPFDDPTGRTFSVDLRGVPPALRRTLTVSVVDEAHADTRFRWSWKVLPALGPVLLVADSGPSAYFNCYQPVMDQVCGAGNWSLYPMGSSLSQDRVGSPELYYIGLPDRLWTLRETFRQFPVVLWYTGSSASLLLRSAVNTLVEYLAPADGAAPGRLILVDKLATGSLTNLPTPFINTTLGVNRQGAPPAAVIVPVGKRALGQRPGGLLPTFTSVDGVTTSTLGLLPLAGTEALYKLESYQYNPRPPYEPVVITRRPAAAMTPLASTILVSLQFESFDRTQVAAALRAMLINEMGVTLP